MQSDSAPTSAATPSRTAYVLRTPVPFNQDDVSSLPSIRPQLSVLPFFPLPNSGANGFIATQTLSREQRPVRRAPGSLPYSRADTLNFRYMFSSGPTTDPLSPAGANVPGFPVGEDDRAQNFVAQETHIFSPTIIGVARFSYLRNTFLLDQHLNHESLSRPRLQLRAHAAASLPGRRSFRSAATLPSAIPSPARATHFRIPSIFPAL